MAPTSLRSSASVLSLAAIIHRQPLRISASLRLCASALRPPRPLTAPSPLLAYSSCLCPYSKSEQASVLSFRCSAPSARAPNPSLHPPSAPKPCPTRQAALYYSRSPTFVSSRQALCPLFPPTHAGNVYPPTSAQATPYDSSHYLQEPPAPPAYSGFHTQTVASLPPRRGLAALQS